MIAGGAILVLLLLLIVPVVPLIVAMWSEPTVPVAQVRATVANPAGTWIALVETVDNRMGFGQGMLYDEVHLVRKGQAAGKHGDDGTSVLFYHDAPAAANCRVAVTWTDDRHLAITYTSDHDTVPWVHQRDGVTIAYTQSACTPSH